MFKCDQGLWEKDGRCVAREDIMMAEEQYHTTISTADVGKGGSSTYSVTVSDRSGPQHETVDAHTGSTGTSVSTSVSLVDARW